MMECDALISSSSGNLPALYYIYPFEFYIHKYAHLYIHNDAFIVYLKPKPSHKSSAMRQLMDTSMILLNVPNLSFFQPYVYGLM